MNASAGKTPRFAIQSTQQPSILDEITGGAPAPPSARPRAVPATPAPTAASRPVRTPTPAAEPAPSSARAPIRVQIPWELADRVRGAIASLQYRIPEWNSLNTATAAALEQLVTQAEDDHNDGQPFPWQPGHKLQPGRRVGQ